MPASRNEETGKRSWKQLRSRVRIEPAAGFAAVIAGQHHTFQERRRRVRRLAELLEHDVRDEVGGVEADEIEQRERAHRIAASQLHPLVDVLERAKAVL